MAKLTASTLSVGNFEISGAPYGGSLFDPSTVIPTTQASSKLSSDVYKSLNELKQAKTVLNTHLPKPTERDKIRNASIVLLRNDAAFQANMAELMAQSTAQHQQFLKKQQGSENQAGFIETIVGLDGNDNFQELFNSSNFPKEAVLAIIADETGSPAHALDNELCNDGLDGGIGIMQLTISYRKDGTFDDPKGLGGGMNTPSRRNDCRKANGWTVATSSYYSNSKQGIYANIKDGFRVLQSKYEAPPVTKGILASTTDSWFTDGTTTINKLVIRLISP